jgi:hypothetical protein
MKTLVVILVFIGCIAGFLYLDNLIVEYALEGVVQYKNILTLILWAVLLFFTGGLIFVFSALITSFVGFFIMED